MNDVVDGFLHERSKTLMVIEAGHKIQCASRRPLKVNAEAIKIAPVETGHYTASVNQNSSVKQAINKMPTININFLNTEFFIAYFLHS